MGHSVLIMGARTSHGRRSAGRVWATAFVAATASAALLVAVPAEAAKAPRARIAYVGAYPNVGILSVDLNGRHRQRLTPKGQYAARPTWTPSGDRIAYLVGGMDVYSQVRVMRPNGTRKRTMLRGGRVRGFLDVAWAPQARRIAVTTQHYDGSAGGVAVYSLKTHKLVGLRVLSGTGWRPSLVDWSPDGTRLIFSAYYVPASNPHDITNADLWSVRPNGTGLRRLTNSPGVYDGAPVWAPRGKRIAYSQGWDCSTVVIANADGTGPRSIPGGCKGDPDWSPGGTHMAVSFRGTGNPYVSRIRTDGSGRVNLAHGYDPAWRPR